MSGESNVVVMPGSTAARIAETGVLLEYPKYVGGLERHDVVYSLSGGRVGRCPLARYRLPEGLRGNTLIGPGVADEDELAMLPPLAELADRIAPWVSVHVVPRILRERKNCDSFARGQGSYDVDGTLYTGAGGIAFQWHDLILLQLGSPVWMAHSLFHEIFHHVWQWNLSDAARAVLAEAVATGPAWPGDYLSSTVERTARLFESWAWARLEGVPAPAPADSDDLTVESVFEFIFSGGLADHQVQRDRVPGAAALAVRRGLELVPQPAPEPPAAPPPRAWADRLVDDILAAGARFDRALNAAARAGRWIVRRPPAAA